MEEIMIMIVIKIKFNTIIFNKRIIHLLKSTNNLFQNIKISFSMLNMNDRNKMMILENI